MKVDKQNESFLIKIRRYIHLEFEHGPSIESSWIEYIDTPLYDKSTFRWNKGLSQWMRILKIQKLFFALDEKSFFNENSRRLIFIGYNVLLLSQQKMNVPKSVLLNGAVWLDGSWEAKLSMSDWNQSFYWVIPRCQQTAVYRRQKKKENHHVLQLVFVH